MNVSFPFLKRLLSVFALVLGFISFLVWILFAFYKEEIAASLLSNLFQTDVKLKSIRVKSHSFPDFIIELDNVIIEGTIQDSLAFCHIPSAYVQIDFLSVFTSVYKQIDIIHLNNPIFFIHLDSLHQKNYRIFKPYDPRRKKPEIVKINRLIIDNAKILYHNEAKKRKWNLQINHLNAKVSIFPHHIVFHFQEEGYINKISEAEMLELDSIPHKIKSSFVYEKIRKMGYFLDTCFLQINGNQFKITGQFGLGSLRNYQLVLFYTEASFSKTITLFLPPYTRKQILKNYHLSGKVYVSGNYIQHHFALKPSQFELLATGKSIQCLHTQTRHGLHHIFFQSAIKIHTYITNKSYEIEISNFKGFFGHYPIRGHITIGQFPRPKVKGQLFVTVPASSFMAFLGITGKSSGYITLSLKGALSDESFALRPYQLIHAPIAIRLVFHQISLEQPSFMLTGLNGDLRWNYPNTSIEASCFFNKQALNLKGSFTYLLPWLLHDQRNSLKGKLFVEGNAIQIDSLISPLLKGRVQVKEKKNLLQKLQAIHNLEIRYYFPYLRWKNLSTQLLKGKAFLTNGKIDLFIDTIRSPILFANLHTRFFWDQQEKIFLETESNFLVKDIYAFFIPFFSSTLPKGSSIFTQNELEGSFLIKGYWHFVKDSFQLRLSFLRGKMKGEKIHLEEFYMEIPIHFSLSHPLHSISIDTFSFTLNGVEQIRGRGLFPDLHKDHFEGTLHGLFRFETISSYLKLDRWLIHPSGKVKLSMFIQSPISALLRGDSLQNSVTIGTTILENVSFLFKQEPISFSNVKGEITYTPDSILIHELTGKIYQSDSFAIKGGVKYFLRFVAEYPKSPLIGYFEGFIDTLNLNRILFHSNKKLSKKISKEGWIFLPLFPPKNQVSLKFYCQTLLIRNEFFDRVLVLLKGKDQNLTITHASAYAFGGYLSLGGNLSYSPQVTDLHLFFHLKGLQIQRILALFNNFNQDFLTYTKLKGDVYCNGILRNRILGGKWDWTRAELLFDLYMIHGQLQNFSLAKPFRIEDSSFFIAEIDSFYMKNGFIQIPFFRILSPQLDLRGKGWHTIRLNYQYDVALYAPPKFYQPQSSNPLHYFTLLRFRIKGHKDHFVIEYDLKTTILTLIKWINALSG